MRWVFFSLRHDPNGGCRLHIDLMNGLAARGHEVYYALPFFLVDRPFWSPCLAERVSAMRVPRMGRFDAVVFSHPDTYLPGYPLGPLVKACDAGRRLFLLRSFLPGHIRVVEDGSIEKVAVSKRMAEEASFYGGPVHRVFGGVNVARFSGRRRRHDDGVPRVLFRDTIDSNKGGAMVKAALEMVRERGVRFEVMRLGGSERQVREQYAEADVFVSGEIEWGLGWSSAVAEAMVSGCAVACTDVCAVEHVAEDEASALVVAPGDADGMADAVERLLVDAELRARLSAEGRRRAARYDTERMVEKLVELVEV